MDFKTLVQQRRSHRKFTAETIIPDDVQVIMRAALMAPTSKSNRSWHFILVDDKTDLEKLSDSKAMGSAFLKDAPLAIVITGQPAINDCWIEDAAIAAFSIQCQAEELGYGSCWVQMDKRGLNDGTPANSIIQGILGIPEDHRVLCVIAIGHPADERKPQNEDKLKWENVHVGKF